MFKFSSAHCDWLVSYCGWTFAAEVLIPCYAPRHLQQLPLGGHSYLVMGNFEGLPFMGDHLQLEIVVFTW